MEWAAESRSRCLLVSSKDLAHLKTVIGMLHDHGIQTEEGSVLEGRPEYYGLLLFSLAGRGTLLRTALQQGVQRDYLHSGGRIGCDVHCHRQQRGVSEPQDYHRLRKGHQRRTPDRIAQHGPHRHNWPDTSRRDVDNDGSITQGTHYAPGNISSSWGTFYVPAFSVVPLRVL
jgi:hypothetical protein